MGMLVEGVWHDVWYDTAKTGGAFKRADSAFRHAVGAAPGARFPVEAGRYHLFVSLACPWAHRTIIFRKLKRLEQAISMSVVDPLMLEQGWRFAEADPLTGSQFLHQVYTTAVPDYTGRVTVPVLWDKQARTIVNNESAEIIRLLNGPLATLGDASFDYYPADLAGEIDTLNARIYDAVNNGVYKAGFATSQEPYEAAYGALFAMLDELEDRLGRGRYLFGDRLTEADWRLFTTLVRFDPVYHGHFKCNRQRLRDFTNLWAYVRDLHQMPGIAETVSLDHIKRHYYVSQHTVNPSGIVPLGPVIDFSEPHGRARLSA
ncbi:MAG TPA: glutathione S-transferase family protein [Aliidongia sp.]|uniref:glutathione S-transferase family protein n=1 Tax=Aliidongia sp. TaxID=1914230 RepID=UPI002DDCE58D|nr:glutathione S-transferase family protein [Aliidongia sp.]HEV2677860.1 glutathione S-transferase family protein [Aliidongia sp.]